MLRVEYSFGIPEKVRVANMTVQQDCGIIGWNQFIHKSQSRILYYNTSLMSGPM